MRKHIIIVAILIICSTTGARAQFFGIKINTLHMATGTVNAGFEMSVEKQWSIDVSAYWNPLRTDKFSSRLWYVQPGVRYWLYEHFVGHFFAAHTTYGRYNFGNEGWYYKGWLTGIGFSYGYTWILTKRWNLTAEGGIGLYYMRDRKHLYEIEDWEPECIINYRRLVVAPSKIEVSFTYLF